MANRKGVQTNEGNAPHPFEGSTEAPSKPRGAARDAKKNFINGMPERFAPPDVPPRKLEDIPEDTLIYHTVCAKEQRVTSESIKSLNDTSRIYCVNCRGDYPADTFTKAGSKTALV